MTDQQKRDFPEIYAWLKYAITKPGATYWVNGTDYCKPYGRASAWLATPPERVYELKAAA